jgi:hypothetical protein
MDGERRVEPDAARVLAQQAGTDAVESAGPGQRADGRAIERAGRRPGCARRGASSRAAARREKVSSRMRPGSAPAATSCATRCASVWSCPTRRRRSPAADDAWAVIASPILPGGGGSDVPRSVLPADRRSCSRCRRQESVIDLPGARSCGSACRELPRAPPRQPRRPSLAGFGAGTAVRVSCRGDYRAVSQRKALRHSCRLMTMRAMPAARRSPASQRCGGRPAVVRRRQ